MGKQLSIFENRYHFNMKEVREGMLLAEIEKLQKEIAKQKLTISAYKGHFTKQTKKK